MYDSIVLTFAVLPLLLPFGFDCRCAAVVGLYSAWMRLKVKGSVREICCFGAEIVFTWLEVAA